ncbi:MAG: hypothetical protein Q9200_000630 [Gallowayella weberi]
MTSQFRSIDNVHYSSRNARISTHSKAGNLNWGLKYTTLLPGGASDFLAVLDVDMIPTSNWLRSLLPHLLQSPQAGMVSPPQNYYNTPLDDRYDEGVFFVRYHDVVTALVDRSGNAMCTGTGFVARRRAIDAIGGFPTASVVSVLTSWKLKADGWQSIYVPERVQWGLGPQTIQSYVRQCQKTADAAASLMQHATQPTGKQKPSMTQIIEAKLMLLLFTTPYWTSTLNMLLVPCTLLYGGLESRYSHALQPTRTATILALTDFAAQYLYGYTVSAIANDRLHVLHHLSTLWVAPHQLLALLFPKGLSKKKASGRTKTYVPTNKASEAEERIAGVALMQRVRSALVNDLALLHCSMFFVCAMSALYWTAGTLKSHGYLIDSSTVSKFILGIGWPPFLLAWTADVANAWTPVSCLFFPPVRPARESLLVPDPATGAAYPSQQAKNNWYRRRGGWHLYTVTLYHIAVGGVLCLVPDMVKPNIY